MQNTNRYLGDKGKEVWKELEKVGRDGYSNYFEDWLDFILNSLLSLTDNIERMTSMAILTKKFSDNKLDGIYNDRYLKGIEKYKSERPIGERPIDFFSKAWGNLAKETLDKKEDILGEIYQQRITFGEHGQFFTPPHITSLMAELVEVKKGEKVYDPCCGSGRFLIAVGKENEGTVLHGTDIDSRCAKMSVINMWLFDQNSLITWGDALTDEKPFKQWVTRQGGSVFEKEFNNK